MLISEIFSVFKQGRVLKSAETWKSKTALANAVAGVLGGVLSIAYTMGYVHVQIDSEVIQAAGLGIASMWAIANSLLHVASTEAAGVPAKPVELPPVPAATNQVPDNTYFG